MKDSNNFLRKLDLVKSVPDNTYFISFDVKSLYTSIPNAEGTKTIKKSFEKHTSKNVADNKGNYSIFGSSFNLKQLCVQLRMLPSNK